MKIVVIGAGAAGLLAAGKAAETADEVVIIEKNDISFCIRHYIRLQMTI